MTSPSPLMASGFALRSRAGLPHGGSRSASPHVPPCTIEGRLFSFDHFPETVRLMHSRVTPFRPGLPGTGARSCCPALDLSAPVPLSRFRPVERYRPAASAAATSGGLTCSCSRAHAVVHTCGFLRPARSLSPVKLGTPLVNSGLIGTDEGRGRNLLTQATGTLCGFINTRYWCTPDTRVCVLFCVWGIGPGCVPGGGGRLACASLARCSAPRSRAGKGSKYDSSHASSSTKVDKAWRVVAPCALPRLPATRSWHLLNRTELQVAKVLCGVGILVISLLSVDALFALPLVLSLGLASGLSGAFGHALAFPFGLSFALPFAFPMA